MSIEDKLIKANREFHLNENHGMNLSDKEFDELEAEVLRLNPNSTKWDYIPITDKGTKHSISYPNPPKNKEDLWDGSFKKIMEKRLKSGLIPSAKMDGSSVTAYYKKGKLKKVLTRSNETTGLDRTASLGPLFPERIDPRIKAISAEMVIDLKHASKFNNIRNQANGFVNNKHDPERVRRYLQPVGFSIEPEKEHKDAKKELYTSIQNISSFLNVFPKGSSGINLEDAPEYQVGDSRFFIDGICWYDSDYNLKVIDKFYYLEYADVRVKSIEWNLSDKCAFIPKIKIDPIRLDNTSIRQLASNGIQFLKDNGISKGSLIRVARSGSTIPQVIKTLERVPFEYPKCPYCSHGFSGSDLINSALYCPTVDCASKANWIKRHIGAVTWDKVKANPEKYSILALNLDRFDVKKKRKRSWSKTHLSILEDTIESSILKLLKNSSQLFMT